MIIERHLIRDIKRTNFNKFVDPSINNLKNKITINLTITYGFEINI